MNKTQVYFIVSFFLLQPAFGQNELGNGAALVINDLLKKNINSVGELDLRLLSNELKTLNWEVTTEAPPLQISRGRRSAYYLQEDKKIVITHQPTSKPTIEPALDLVSVKYLELHEALGALGYRDHNYSQSSAMVILSKTMNGSRRKNLVESFGKSVFNKENLKAAKGGSSVGGGGDSIALAVKLAVLDQILKSEIAELEFYALFVEINFEPAPGPFVQVDYSFAKPDGFIRGAPTGPGHTELLTINFPDNSINSEVISKMSNIIKSLIPTHSNVESHTLKVTGEGCKNSDGIRFPKVPDDSDILSIQIARASFLLDCDTDGSNTIFSSVIRD